MLKEEMRQLKIKVNDSPIVQEEQVDEIKEAGLKEAKTVTTLHPNQANFKRQRQENKPYRKSKRVRVAGKHSDEKKILLGPPTMRLIIETIQEVLKKL